MSGTSGWDNNSDEGWGNEDSEMQGEPDQCQFNEDVELPQLNEKGYKVVRSQQVSEQVLVKISELQDLYNLPLDQLIVIARHYEWNQDKMQDWFVQQESLKFQLGLSFDYRLPQNAPHMNTSLPNQHGGYCQVCYSEITDANSYSLDCKHTFCSECWTDYLTEKVRSGYQGINASCMQGGCNMKVQHSTFERYLTPCPKDKETYWKWLCKSFTDENKNIKWCPNVQCEYCCERQDQSRVLQEITCECGTLFCFMCGNYSHKPCDCDAATKWLVKASAESENVLWISANTKACPKCKKNIEKNHGCNHMQCVQCKWDFCWVCLGEWKEHGSATGGYYKCNLYETKKKDNTFSEEETKRENAKNELQRYMWYYERYANHERSMKLAEKLMPVIKQKVMQLHNLKHYPPKELEFMENGCDTVIQCRDVLKWTYAYGYYYSATLDVCKKNLFESWQSDLEKYCDHLHELVEKDLDQFMDPNITDRNPFYLYRGQLTSFYESTKRFYKNLVQGLEESDAQ